jgi:hypothetical protein
MMRDEVQRVLQVIVHDPYLLLLVPGGFMLFAYGLWHARRLSLQLPTTEPPEISIADVLLWAQNPETSIAQISKFTTGGRASGRLRRRYCSLPSSDSFRRLCWDILRGTSKSARNASQFFLFGELW